MSTALIPQAQFDQIVQIDETCKQAQLAIIKADKEGQQTIKALVTARATRTLQKLLTEDMMQDIMALQGTPLGFKTDKDRPKNPNEQKGYPVAVVRDVVIQALMRGFQVTGNQINIIAGNLYVTKEGFESRLKNFDGLQNFAMDFEIPDRVKPNTAYVSCRAKWVLHGELMELRCSKSANGDYRIPVKTYDTTTDDEILGKAKSKLLRKVFERISGWNVESIDDPGTIEADAVASVQSSPVVEQSKQDPKGLEDTQPFEEPLSEKDRIELESGLAAVESPAQLQGLREHWRSKAKNREFSDGQKLTIKSMFDARKAFLGL